jgi:hypothetical protein
MRSIMVFRLSLALMFSGARPGLAWQHEKPDDLQKKTLVEWINVLREGVKGSEEPRQYWAAREALGPRGPYANVAVPALLETFKNDKFKSDYDKSRIESGIVGTLADYGPGAVNPAFPLAQGAYSREYRGWQDQTWLLTDLWGSSFGMSDQVIHSADDVWFGNSAKLEAKIDGIKQVPGHGFPG